MSELFSPASAADIQRASTISRIFMVLPNPILVIGADELIHEANPSAEAFFELSRSLLKRQKLSDLLPQRSPLLNLVAQVRERNALIHEYKVELGLLRLSTEKTVDIQVLPLLNSEGEIAIVMSEMTMALKIDRQLTHRGAARSVSALAAMLAHEIKNPLAGIRGAAQLLESDLPIGDSDRHLTQLICMETDRIVKLVDKMEMFSDGRPLAREPVNIHSVLDIAKRSAAAGFARHISVVEQYDPSLPPVLANRDQLVQTFLNLLKNAAEAIGNAAVDGEIVLSTAYRPGVRLRTGQGQTYVSLPLEIVVRDNGPGVSEEILPMLFDPFVTSKVSGTGLGLAMVAKIIGDHGGTIECESQPRRTLFRVLLPVCPA